MTAAPTTSRVDLHCHSSASQVSKLGVQRALGLPECATPPEGVYELAKRRGMDFVTLTDHDVIDGAVELAERYDDAFVSVELTCRFRGEPQAVHVLCWGIEAGDFEALRAASGDVEEVAAYLDDHHIASALAHPFFAVAAPLTARHRRRLAELFAVWETRNGSRAPELNAPAALYIDTHGGTGTGGSDDHAGVDVGRTYTETSLAGDWQTFLAHVRHGAAQACGAQGSAAKWAHAAMAIAVRTLGGPGTSAAVQPAAVWRMVERVMREGDARRGAVGADLGPADARALLRSWLAAVELDADGTELLERLQADGFSHADLARRARHVHERKLRDAVQRATADPLASDAASGLFDACVAVIPYAPAVAFLGRERAKLLRGDGDEPRRVALVADGIGAVHGVTRAVEIVRELGVPGFEVEVVGTDRGADRRLGAVAEVDVGDLEIGIPALPTVVEALADGRYDLVHVCSPGPVGVAAALVARVMDLPLVGSYHTELGTYAAMRTGDARLSAGMSVLVARLYGACDRVLSPSLAADHALAELGVPAERLHRWDRGVDGRRFSPGQRATVPPAPGRVNVLYAGRVAREKGIGLLADAFELARLREPRLHLLVAGSGPEEAALRRRLGKHASFLGWLEGAALARAYACADIFCFCSQTDTFGQVVLEAQASGLPVVAVDAGGPAELVADGRSGVLCPADADAIAAALAGLAASRAMRRRLGRGAVAAVRDRTWGRSMEQLAAGWRAALQVRDTARRAA